MLERMISHTSSVRVVAQISFHLLSASPVTESVAFCVTKKEDTHVYYNQIAGAAAPATAATAATTAAAASATAALAIIQLGFKQVAQPLQLFGAECHLLVARTPWAKLRR